MTHTSNQWRIGADVPDRTRAFLLRRFKPAFTNVQCKVLTHAYRVPDSFPSMPGPLKVTVYGYHRGETHEALLVSVNGHVFRPDRSRYFIALSIDAGEEPARAADIDSDSIQILDQPIQLDGMQFKTFPLWNRNVTKKAA